MVFPTNLRLVNTKLVLSNAPNTSQNEERVTFHTSTEEYKLIAVKRLGVDYGGSYGCVPESQVKRNSIFI
jgi:hypothetical protein